MNKASRIILLPLVAGLLWACGCTQERMGMTVPVPGTKPTAGEVPADPENPGGTDDPSTPTEPVTEANPWDSPERQARIGITPIIEVYYTEYTKKALFPSLEEVRNFTHINVGHVRFKDKVNGVGLEIPEESVSLAQRFVAYKAGYPELKVKFQMGGWGKNADGWSRMARDPDKRKAFVDECVAVTQLYGTDGFDIDWEYPTYAAKDGEYVNGADPSDWGNFITLLKEMREAMPDKILSYAASSSGKYTDNVSALQYVDYINVMTYDEGNPPYHNSPLYRSAVAGSRTCAEAIDDIFHGKQEIPYQMMNFGLPFYGHGDGYKLASGNTYPATVNYGDLEEIFFKGTCDGKSVAGKNYRVWDDVAKVPYLADALGKMYASYEDIESINAKVEFLKSRNMLGAMIWEYREDNDEGTLRHAVKHAMDGNPDAPGRYERPEDNMPLVEKDLPVMGSHTTWKLQKSSTDFVVELSGMCLSKDGDFLWGVGDNGNLYKINFDGSYESWWTYDADMEGITIDPATGDLYMGIEPKRVYKLTSPYKSKTTLFDVADAANMGNSGIEGITWHKGNLYLGAQTGATLWEYTLSGTQLSKKSLRDVTSTISEIADLCYDPVNDWLWVIDSNSNKDKPQYLGYTVYLFDGDATKLLATYYVGDFANWNPETICVDRAHGCIWIADDCGDDYPSLLHKVMFTNL